MKKLYVDMDGVLCDFDSQCRKFFPDIKSGETPHDYALRTGTNKFWKRIRESKGAFWSTMTSYPNVDIVKVWSLLCEISNNSIYILSSPDTKDPKCIVGKNEWLDKYLGRNICPLNSRIFETKKALYSNSSCVLIDDSHYNLDAWSNEGGLAIYCNGSVSFSEDSDLFEKLKNFFHEN